MAGRSSVDEFLSRMQKKADDVKKDDSITKQTRSA